MLLFLAAALTSVADTVVNDTRPTSTRRNVGKYALRGTVKMRHYGAEETDVDVYEYVNANANSVRHHLNNAIRAHRSIKWYATLDLSFRRVTPDGDEQRTTGRFRTQPEIISNINDVTTDHIADQFAAGIENFNKRGSNWLVDYIIGFRITYAPFRPAQGTSFIPTPREIALKKAILNIQNLTDELCFLYSVLAAIHPVDSKMKPSQVFNYRRYLNELNTDGLEFPLPVKDVSKFENQNTNIAVSVVAYEDRELIPLYVSPHRDREHIIQLLLLSDGNTHHYTPVSYTHLTLPTKRIV